MAKELKILKIYRNIGIYRNDSDEYVDSISIERIPLEELWRILGSPADDPNLSGPTYGLDREQLEEMKKYVNFEYDLNTFAYCYDVEADYE